MQEFSVISSPQNEEMSSGNDELEAELDEEAMQEVGGRRQAGFLLCIAKISQGLRKFRNHSEHFAIPAKFSLCTFFRYHSESYCA